jgi:hypothetical protein
VSISCARIACWCRTARSACTSRTTADPCSLRPSTQGRREPRADGEATGAGTDRG